MCTLAWNYRGGGNRRTVRELVVLCQTHNPSLVFLCETRQSEEKMEKLRWRLGLRGFEGIGSDGRSGGLALYWHESLHVEVKGKSNRYIDVCVRKRLENPTWQATFVYGEPRVENQHHMWSLLSDLRANNDEPWLVMGDYNEALWQHEHMSRCARPEAQMVAFHDVLATCELMDLGFKGFPFTYDNHQAGINNVKGQLDQACADSAWRDLFPSAGVEHLVSPRSDHCPILLHWREKAQRPRNCMDRYEIVWERDASLGKIISKAWERAQHEGNLGNVVVSLKQVMKELKVWSKEKFGNVRRELEELRKELV